MRMLAPLNTAIAQVTCKGGLLLWPLIGLTFAQRSTLKRRPSQAPHKLMAVTYSKFKRSRVLLCISIISAAFISPASAQDLATEHTQILNNIELITENLRRLQSLYNQIAMIKNQVEGLKSVASYQNNFSDIDALRNKLTDITSQGTALSDQTQGLLTRMQQEINHLPADGTMTDRESSIDQSTMDILQNALNRVTQERQNYQHETDAVNALLAKSEQAVGQTQALQTSNEMAAQTIAQMQSTRELLSENIIVQAVTTMREIQERRDMINTMNQMMGPDDNSDSGVSRENEP